MLAKLQTMGKSLMLPIAVLPIAGILLRLGQGDLLGGSDIAFIAKLGAIMAQGGGAIFGQLPLLFAIGVGIGFSKDNAGAAALASAMGYFVMTAAMGAIDEGINMGVLGGIVVGLIASFCYNKWFRIQLPDWLAFFSGKRFVPIITGLFCLMAAIIFGFLWPPIQDAIRRGGNALIEMGAWGAGIYGFLNRLLLPVGLHHVLNTLVWFEFGEFTNAAGEVVNGDLSRFFAGDPGAGIFMAGFFPIMMFGLPAAALAMYATAKVEQRKMVLGMLFSVAFTSFLTGITEPIEYAFMFLAPLLYLFHALISGISLGVAYVLGYRAGFSFSAGAIDAILSWGIATKPWLLLPLGAIAALLYYAVFAAVIKRFNVGTPGRTELNPEQVSLTGGNSNYTALAIEYYKALGGRKNIKSLDNCITRLRLEIIDRVSVNEAALKQLGAKGVVKVGQSSLQVIVGSQVEALANAMKDLNDEEANQSGAPAAIRMERKVGSNNAGTIDIAAPIAGTVMALEDVPDEAFAQKMTGDGLAIMPAESQSQVCAPIAGTIGTILEQCHAFFMETSTGQEILVHIGVDTVKLNGEGFKALVEEGAEVEVGQPIIEIDQEILRAKAPSLAIPVLCANMDEVKDLLVVKEPGSEVQPGTILYSLKL
ncbi:MAG: N-acetylglucosamine-specific PTS transporter subunit IIBC [Spirochaetota bacterium]